MEEPPNKTVSFGLIKKSENKVISQTKFSDGSNVQEETDYITSLENQTVQSVKPKQEKKEIIIPLIKTNNWKTDHVNKTQTDKPPTPTERVTDGIDTQAIKEIMQDTAKQLDTWQTRGVVDPNIEIPLLMQNQVPEGFETDERLDVSLRPDGPEDTDYDEVPIEAFGMAMLKGMGWKVGEGIGKNNKAIAPVDAVLRPKGMGLGADRKQAQNLNNAKQGGNSKNDDSGELSLKKGAFCLIENGPHKDLYAVIEGMDEDNARLMLKLTVSGKLVTVSQYNTKLVTKEEYNKYSKYINKGAADRYKEKEDKKKDKKERSSDRENESHREKKHRKEEDRLSAEEDRYKDKHDRKKDKYRDKERDRSNKKRKHEDDRSHKQFASSSSSHTNGSSKSQSMLWVRPKLRVRLVDEHYKKGKYYNNKIVIVDVSDRDHCVCQTDEGKVLEDISQSMLETMVPKSDSSYISIVSGKYRGQLGQVLERDKKRCQALVQLLSDRDKVLQLDYDSICEYVGDINEEFDY